MSAQTDNRTAGDGPRAAVVILAGGMGSRLGAGVNKVYLPIRGRNILDYSVDTALACPLVTDVVLVHRPDDADQVAPPAQRVDQHPTTTAHTTPGGETRHLSERAGVSALRSLIDGDRLDVVAVHDGARPFMSPALLDRLLRAAEAEGSAVPGLAVTDALYSLDRQRFVPAADHVWVQTPQAFDASTLLTAHDRAAEVGFQGVDTAEVVQRFSDTPVRVIAGEEANIKITYETDLATAEKLAADWEAARKTALETGGESAQSSS